MNTTTTTAGRKAVDPPESRRDSIGETRLRRRVVALFGALAMFATLITLSAPAPASAAPSVEATGWVYASRPTTWSYVPSGYNSEGHRNKIVRISTGRYKVTFARLDRRDQEVQVVAQGNGSLSCGLDQHADNEFGARNGMKTVDSDLNVYVACYGTNGALPVDSRFVASMTGQNGESSLSGAGVIVNQAGTSVRGYSSAGDVYVERVAVGVYDIRFDKHYLEAANLQVTAVSGLFGNFCTIASFGLIDYYEGGARIHCWSVEWAADTAFSMRLTMPQPGNVAFGQTGSVPLQWQGPTGSYDGMQVQEPSGGRQTVTFPDLNGTPAGLMVTPMTNSPVRCSIATWSYFPVSTSVACTTATNGEPSTSAFSLWARTPPSKFIPVFTVPTTNPPKWAGFPTQRGR